MPIDEYRTRLNELQSYSKTRGFPLVIEIPDIKNWVSHVKDSRYSGEGSARCWKCYEYRLEKTFQKAVELDFNIVATTLSISPHKDIKKINEIGKRLSGKYSIDFCAEDFKKNDGVKKSIEISKKNNFYRQNYCGCIYSKLERNKSGKWATKMRETRLKNSGQINHEEGVEVEINFGQEIDLHHFHPADTKLLVEKFLENAIKEQYSTVRIIHGKGKSVKKRYVYEILKSHPAVASYNDDSYNWGATIITLNSLHN
jgi:epoxyqueuosine reductase